jgi:hypothetical protein
MSGDRATRSPRGDVFIAAAAEEEALRLRVRTMRLQQLEDDLKARRIEFLREDEAIRAEIVRLRKLLVEAQMAMAAPPSAAAASPSRIPVPAATSRKASPRSSPR